MNKQEIAQLTNEELEGFLECAADSLAQYQSECGQFGDAGPGQGSAPATFDALSAESRRRRLARA